MNKQSRHILSGTIIFLLTILALPLQAQAEWSWGEASSMNVGRKGYASAVFNGKIYVFGGQILHRQMQIDSGVEIYDPVRDRWSGGENMPLPLYQASAVVHDTLIFIFGGTSRGEMPNEEILVYSPTTNQFFRTGRMPSPRRAMGAISSGKKILVIGGIAGRQDYQRSGYWWNPDSLQWREAPALIRPNAGFGIAYNGVFWIVGGLSFGPLNRVEILRNDTWTSLPRRGLLPVPRGELGVAFFNDTLLIAAGGIGPDGVSDRVLALSIDTLMWRDFPAMNQARAEFSLIPLGGKIYAIGGGRSHPNQMGNILSSVEVLTYSNSVERKGEDGLPGNYGTYIWPNPANGLFKVQFFTIASRIQVVDSNGRIVRDNRVRAPGLIWSDDALRYTNGHYQIIYFDAAGNAYSGGGLTVLK